jgi:hypothetical protein
MWVRTGDGDLLGTDQDPGAYYDISEPASWGATPWPPPGFEKARKG